MGNQGVDHDTSNGLSHNLSEDEVSRIAKELAATNTLALNCAMHRGDVPAESAPEFVESVSSAVEAPSKTGPQGDDVWIPLEQLSGVIGKAFRIQGEMDSNLEANNKAESLEALRKEVIEQRAPKLSFKELADKVKSLGISPDALAKALEPSPAEQLVKNHKELVRGLGLPENASRESLILEHELQSLVSVIKWQLPGAIRNLQNPLNGDVEKLGEFEIIDKPDTSLVFKRAGWKEALNLAYHISNPLGWFEGFIEALDSPYSVFHKCFDLGETLSPALKELQSMADELGGVISFRIPRGQGPTMLFGKHDSSQGQVEILLKLKKL